MTSDEIRMATIAELRGDLNDILNEIESRYQDGYAHALIAEIRQRENEALTIRCPLPGSADGR